MKDNPRVLILIVNWNNFPDTKDCLASLPLLAYDNYQVMVVDNGSSDGSGQLIRKEFPEVKLVVLDENLGFAGGNNAGLRIALEGEIPYILLLNNDTTVLDGEFLGELVSALEGEQDVGAVGPAVEESDGITQLSILPYPNIGNTLINTLGLYHPNHNKRQYVDSIAGCCVLVRREAILEAGLLDENYFMYAEETEWFYRIRKKGWNVLFIPIRSVFHKGAASSNRIKDNTIYLERRANVIYTLVKHQQIIQAGITVILMGFLLGVRILWSGIMAGKTQKQRYPISMFSEFFRINRQKWILAAESEKIQG